ncbi:MAG: hypothetical protein DDT19_02610 [Syntrophomonadaceae bacterium]|nr:hypothetical protein [Bacillota bacterium]
MRIGMEEMRKEHLAWQRVVEELKKLGVDINKHDKLADAIRIWGEKYVELVNMG